MNIGVKLCKITTPGYPNSFYLNKYCKGLLIIMFTVNNGIDFKTSLGLPFFLLGRWE